MKTGTAHEKTPPPPPPPATAAAATRTKTANQSNNNKINKSTKTHKQTAARIKTTKSYASYQDQQHGTLPVATGTMSAVYTSTTHTNHSFAWELVGCLLNVPATCYCVSGTDHLRLVYVLPH